jgi:hypothetical protein
VVLNNGPPLANSVLSSSGDEGKAVRIANGEAEAATAFRMIQMNARTTTSMTINNNIFAESRFWQ